MKHVLNFNDFINEAKQHIDLFPTKDDMDSAIEFLKKELEPLVPYIKFSKSTLGGDDIMFDLSFEPKEEWSHGFFMNSNRCQFTVEHNGTVHAFTCSLYEKGKSKSSETRLGIKFRKATCKTIEEVSKKLVKFINEVKNEYK